MIALLLASGGVAAPAHARSALQPPFFGLGKPVPPPAMVFSYHGWRIDAARAARAQPPDKTIRAIKAELDLVEHLGLKPDVLNLMRAVPITVVPDARVAVAYARTSGVTINVRRMDAKKPLALVGLLQAYADRGLPGGGANADVARYRREAIAAHVWPKTALMLQSDADFFALSASAYLIGAITREPYTRADLRKTQPQYYQWLARLFDGGVARR